MANINSRVSVSIFRESTCMGCLRGARTGKLEVCANSRARICASPIATTPSSSPRAPQRLWDPRRPALACSTESDVAMPRANIFNREFDTLKDTDSVADATRRMLLHRVSDLPVVDADGRFIGMFKLERLLAALLPAAALVGYGMPDLSFVSDDLDALCEKMRALDERPVAEFAEMPDQVVHPDDPPLEMVLQLYRGANNLPVV